ncbi:hypothetical protein F383_34804 [Gossypium arboreum]|uniref:Uncharacterized protein n=1 Tax=Gossypium arboreum TaxID=29729 RepID=A0A0B0PYK7_GOSAR|nr:hypothetical protein F383_34804 [Gossypium arboreum]
MICWIPSSYPSMKLLRASLYAEALVMYNLYKAGFKVSIPPLAAIVIKSFPYTTLKQCKIQENKL